MMIFKELRYILAVKECGNLSKAAEKLYLTQPALSRYIKNLEDSLDIKLFEHSGRKLILTDAGLRYVDAAYKMLDMYEDLLNDLHASDDTIRGSLRVGTTRQRGPMLLPGIVTRFHHSFPNVKLSLFEENSFTLEKMLADGDLDIIIKRDRSVISDHLRRFRCLLKNCSAPFPETAVSWKNTLIRITFPARSIRFSSRMKCLSC
ncbi:MAG: LysR family transcriptional regulator [Solobacterium sp.]|nr:LysR family transcriptional regulator [Solobacterium sp.]